MNRDADRNALRGLFAGFTDGTLSSEDHARLEEILSRSPEARRQWFLHCDIEIGLADWAAAQRARSSQSPVFRRPSEPARSRWFRTAPLAAAAALLLLASLWWMRVPNERATGGVAMLARAAGAVWEGGDLAAGAVLPPGTVRLKAGAALIEFYSGARVVVEGPAEFRLTGANEGFLQSGKISAHVPAQARGFTVGAPGVRLIDQGTEFGLAVRQEAPPEVHVFNGRVDVAAAGAAARALVGGEAVRLQPGGWRSLEADRTAFLTESEVVRRDAANAARRFAEWREAARSLSADPAAALHYVFEGDPALDRAVRNEAAGASDETHGTVVGGGRAEGRWPGKRALDFRHEGDRIRLSIPQALEQITLLAWVRLEALPREFSPLLYADAEQTGSLRWELTAKGQLRLGIGRDLGRARLDWEAVNSAPLFPSDRLDRWTLLTTTFDGATVRHYADGRLVGDSAAFRPPALHIGAASIGNWNGRTLRRFQGALDEFAVLARALTPDEVRAVYEAGKP